MWRIIDALIIIVIYIHLIYLMKRVTEYICQKRSVSVHVELHFEVDATATPC